MRKFKVIFILVSMLGLTSCFQTGENQGSNLLTVSGSLLKGSTQGADITIYNTQGQIVWQGQSDADGNYNAELSSSQAQVYTIVATLNDESSMVCDASECSPPNSDNSYQFGESMPGSELGEVELSTMLYLDAPTDSTINRTVVQQLNSMSSLVADVMSADLNTQVSATEYDEVVEAASDLVLSSFGITLADSSNKILEMDLPDLTVSGSTDNASDDAITLGLINASHSSDLDHWRELSGALITLKGSPEDADARSRVSEAQQHVMANAQTLLDDQSLGIDNDHAHTTVSGSVEDGVDFNDMEETISELNVVEEQAGAQYRVATVTVSSSLYGAAASRSYNEPQGQWWWVSAPGIDLPQWVVLEYAEAFVPAKVEIGMSWQFYGHGSVLQGSNDAELWVDLFSIDDIDLAQQSIDERKVKHLDVNLDTTTAYKYYRYHSEPSKHIWLEYICISQSDDLSDLSIDLTAQCQAPKMPSGTDVSSQALSGKRVADPNNNSWWASQMASSEPQWVALEYEQAFTATNVVLKLKQQQHSESGYFQGSNDGSSWTDIGSFAMDDGSIMSTDNKGFLELELSLENSQSFLHYRYYTEPTGVVWLAYLSFRE